MKRYLFIVVVTIVSSCIFFSCQKDKTTAAQTCFLSTVTDSTTSLQAVTQFGYDNSNRLSAITITGQNACKRTFQYYGNTVVFTVTDTTPGIRNEIDTIVLNSAGLIITLSGYYPTNNESYVQTFFYDQTGQVSTGSVMKRNGVLGDTLEYLTLNGDIIYEKVKGQTTNKNNFTYYPSQEIVYTDNSQNIIYGDPTDFRQLLYYGAYYYKNAHLLKVMASPGSSYKEYSYTFQNNRIATSTLRWWKAGSADTVAHAMNYAYSCK